MRKTRSETGIRRGVEHSFQSHPCFDPGGRDSHQNREQGKDNIKEQTEG